MSENINKIDINKAPKWFKALLLIISIGGGFILISHTLDNDFYFIYPMGEYIWNNGFATKDMLSMHSSMDIIIQQWLSDVVYYLIYSRLGKSGVIVFINIMYLIFATLIFRLNYIVTNKNFFVSSISSFVTNSIIAPMFFVSRPQIFTYLLIATELLVLEKFVLTKKNKYLIFIPVISLILINTHSSMWMMIFVFMLPYFAQSISFKIGKLQQESCCSFTALFVTALASFAMGFINPYGTKAMLYITTSFGYEEISSLINEMSPLSLSGKTDLVIIAVIAATLFTMTFVRSKIETRFFFLYVGTLFLSLMSSKSSAYFLIAGLMAFSHYMRDFSFSLELTDNSNNKNVKKRIALTVALILMVGVLGFSVYYTSSHSASEPNNKESEYTALNEIAEILESYDSDIVLYTGFDYGQYMEFCGFHPYIDGRAELFVKDNNHEYDYMLEYYKLIKCQIYYKDFINKYSFNFLIVTSKEAYLYNSLLSDDDFEQIYTKDCKDETLTLFKSKS